MIIFSMAVFGYSHNDSVVVFRTLQESVKRINQYLQLLFVSIIKLQTILVSICI